MNRQHCSSSQHVATLRPEGEGIWTLEEVRVGRQCGTHTDSECTVALWKGMGVILRCMGVLVSTKCPSVLVANCFSTPSFVGAGGGAKTPPLLMRMSTVSVRRATEREAAYM